MSCKLCKNLVISTAVTINADNQLVITVPSGTYANGHKYCIIVAQAIPSTVQVAAPVYIQIGTNTTLYPLNKSNGAQATAASMRTRTKYGTVVSTTPTSGSFNLINPICCCPNYDQSGLTG